MTRLVKFSKNIQTNIEYQLQAIMDFCQEHAKQESATNALDPLAKKIKTVSNQIEGIQRRFSEFSNQNCIQFSANILKEYEMNSSKEVASNILLIKIQQQANCLLKMLQRLIDK